MNTSMLKENDVILVGSNLAQIIAMDENTIYFRYLLYCNETIYQRSRLRDDHYLSHAKDSDIIEALAYNLKHDLITEFSKDL